MTFGKDTQWSEEIIKQYHELLDVYPKLAYGVIADRLNEANGTAFTKNSCIGFARRNGLPQRRPARRRRGRMPAKRRQWVPKQHLKAVPRPPPKPGKLRIWQLDPEQCKWPIDDISPFFFCGKQRIPGQSYCLHHAHLSCPVLARQR